MSTPTTETILPLLRPVVALVGWTFGVESWMYMTRIPALRRLKVALTPESTNADMNKALPAIVRWKGENYNHLHEAPTRFYAICLTLALLHSVPSFNSSTTIVLEPTPPQIGTLELSLAWSYVAVRIVHSLVHALANPLLVRFRIYTVSEVLMLGLFVRTVGTVIL